MGVAGASPGEGSFVLLAGIAGLLAGAFSMAAGEYISMQCQRELFERQIALERAELEAMPEEEQAELAAVYRSKGFTEAEAEAIAERMFADPEHALDTLVREELGSTPTSSARRGAPRPGSFVAFAIGALVPVLPYLFGGAPAFVPAIALSVAALFAVGAGVSLLTGRGLLFSGSRQVLIGAAAAVVTYLVGHLHRGHRLAPSSPRRPSRASPLARSARPAVAATGTRDGARRTDSTVRGSIEPRAAAREPLGDPGRLRPPLELADVLLAPPPVHRHDRDEAAAGDEPDEQQPPLEFRHQAGRIGADPGSRVHSAAMIDWTRTRSPSSSGRSRCTGTESPTRSGWRRVLDHGPAGAPLRRAHATSSATR